MMSKKLISVAGVLSAIVLFGFTAIASPAGQIEGGNIYRVKNVTTNSEFMDPASGTCGNTFQFKVRIHNPGPDILSNVKVKATLPDTVATSHSSTVTISADNANPSSRNDTAGVKLDKAAALKYISGSTELLDANGSKLSTLGDTIFTTGVSIGSVGVSTQQKRFVQFSVKTDCEKPPVKQIISCDALQVNILNKDKREVEAKVTGSATNTKIDGYKIDFGDGTTVNEQTAKHTYGDYGKYTIVAHVSGKVDGKTETVTSAACKKTVEFKKPPVKQSISCDALQVNILNKDKREVEAKVTGSATNTKIDGYKIDFGDGTTVNEQTAKHTYGDYGKYTVTAYVSGMVDGKKVEVSGPGCVQTVEFKKPPKPQEQMISCDALALDVFNKDTKYVEVSVTGSAQNTKIDGYKIDFGDGTTVNEQTAKHTYGDYGTYTIVAHVSGKVDGKTETVTSAACKKTVEFKKPPTPEIQSIICDALNLDLFNKDKRYVKVSVDATAQNTKIDTYEISFGDGSSPVMEQTAEHTYGDYGTYKIVAAVSGQVDGETVTDTNVNCEQIVEFKAPEEPETPPTTPETPELPNTGAGALVGLFSGASILGAVGHRVWTVRRLQ